MTPGELLEILEFKAKVPQMTNADLAAALWEIRIQSFIERNSAEEILLDEVIKRLRASGD